MALWTLSLRDTDRDPSNRDIDNEAQGLAAEAAARQTTGRGSAGAGQPADVRIDWQGMARRARQLTVPGTTMANLTPAPEGHSVALTVVTPGVATGRGGDGGETPSGMYIINVESGQLTRVPPAPPRRPAPAAAAVDAGVAAASAAADRSWRSPGTAGRFTSDPVRPLRGAVPQNAQAAARAGGPRRRGTRQHDGTGGRARDGRRRNGAAGHLHRQPRSRSPALRAQVFNEGWRIMKNRFYDAKMHGADWSDGERLRATARPRRRQRGTAERDDDDDRASQRVAHRRQRRRRTPIGARSRRATRASTSSPIPSGFYKVGHIYKDGPADRDYLKITAGNFVVVDRRPRAEDRRQLLALLHARGRQQVPPPAQRQAGEGRGVGRDDQAGRPAAFGDLQYAQWVDDRREMVDQG